MTKILTLELNIKLEYQNTKTFFLKDMLQIGLIKLFWSKKVKVLFHGHMLLMISMMKKILERFMKKNYKKQIKKDLG